MCTGGRELANLKAAWAYVLKMVGQVATVCPIIFTWSLNSRVC